ncbi:PQQ-dependent sugar dehydrogenase [Hymenobacter artigasi]|uniref:Repeat protein (TIGR02543 family) n=1 Tax=Hymenobacter artigasi TaxID=2719616 RepID=A0ABX1HHL7_9BACT|nr:PQQ-dependent sugar dehydrogenase [Hymenobacter artigasi]NKI88637.1 putative repeat protein (TIGR02543 family) [Hymenobacter artigasi]
MKNIFTAILCALLLLGNAQVQAQTPPTGFTSTVVSAGWNEAVGFTFNSSGNKMFVWERPGKVWVVVNGQRQQLIDISPEVGAWEDQGLLGFALDPNFDANGYMYLLYVVDRHYLINFGTASYSATANDYYSATIGRITRYTATPSGTGYTVNPASRKILLGATKSTGIPSTHDGHCTGSLVFGTDGTLLVSTGDGAHWAPDLGSYNETYYAEALADGIISAKENVGALRAQLVDCLSGKILRLDPATGNGVASNPFYDAANPGAARSKVWTLGLRTPFRMSLRPGTGNPDPAQGNPGTLYVGMVGASTWEEITVVDRARVNLGWPLFEGLTPYPAFSNSTVYNRDAPNPLYNTGGCTKQFFYFQDLLKPATPSGTATFSNSCNTAQSVPASIPTFVHTRPLIDWGHGPGPSRTGTFSGSTPTTANIGAAGSPVSGAQFGGNSVTGGVFYPYSDFPAPYANSYFFGDYVGGWIKSMTVNSSNQPSAVRSFVDTGAVPVFFGTSPGETGLFYVNFYPSEIRKISYVTTASPPVAVATSSKTYGPGPLTVQFTGSNSTDPNGSPLTYSWNFGDGTAPSAAANPSHTFSPATAAATNYSVTLTVTNAQGLSNQASLSISANNTPPQVTITSPAAGTVYPLTGNTTYQLRATVVDAEQSGHLLFYKWQTVLHHLTHLHPDPVDTTRQTSTIVGPYGCGAETYYYTVALTVTDAGGLSTTQQVRLDPDCTTPSFTLVDADAASDADIQPLTNGAILNLATLPTRHLNIRANADPATTGSMVFSLTGPQTQAVTDNAAPFALFLDVNGDYNSWTPPVGNYQLTATGYSGANGSGTARPPLTVSFTVTDSNAPGPFALTTATVGTGTVTKNPNAATYASGSTVSLTATPGAGFTFAGWSGDASGSTNPLAVTMTADKSITATFTAISGGGGYTFYRAINLGGPALTLDGNAWGGSTAANYATNGSEFENQAVALVPTTDAVRAGMIRQAVFGPDLSVGISAVPAGTYQAYLYVWEDSGPEVINLSLNGQVKLSNYSTGPAGTWNRLGPYNVTLAATGTVQFTSTGGWPNFSGMELWQQTGGTPTSYTLTTGTVGSGTVTKNPNAATYTSGSTVSLTATPAAGYQFSGWSGDASGTANPLSVTITANKNITATFTVVASATYTLNTNVVGAGTVAKNPDQANYTSGSTVSLTATPGAGYQFSGWSGDASGTANPLSVTMNANKNITATFTALPAGQSVTSYTLINADTNGDIQPLAAGTTLNLATLPTRNLNVRANTNPGTVGSVVFTLSGADTQNQTESVVPYALFSDSGGAYNSWTPAVGSYSLTATPYTAASGGGTAGTPLTISFSVIDQAGTAYTLTTATVGTGTVTKSPNAASYASGSTVSLTATAGAGYQFSGWSGDATGSTNPLSVTMNGNKTITATFTATPTTSYTLTTSTVGTGTVTKNPNAASYASGSTVSLTATPGAGFAFTGWSGDATGTANPLSVTMSGNKNITATFTATSGGGYTFYRAINLGGPALTLDGNAWGGSTAANYSTNGSAFQNQALTLIPATDATRAGMIRAAVFGPGLSVTLSAVPAATYQAYLYVWEDNSPEVITLSLNGQVKLSNYSTGPAGTWSRLGPYTVTLATTGSVAFTSSGGWPNFSGVELWQQTSAPPAARTASQTLAANTPEPTPALAVAYPNPSPNGHFRLLLPATFSGAVRYRLISVLGATLASGTLPAGAQAAELDFAQPLSGTSLSYLLLDDGKHTARLKLVRQ